MGTLCKGKFIESFTLMELIVLNSSIQLSEFQNQQLIFDPKNDTYWQHDIFYKHIPKFHLPRETDYG